MPGFLYSMLGQTKVNAVCFLYHPFYPIYLCWLLQQTWMHCITVDQYTSGSDICAIFSLHLSSQMQQFARVGILPFLPLLCNLLYHFTTFLTINSSSIVLSAKCINQLTYVFIQKITISQKQQRSHH